MLTCNKLVDDIVGTFGHVKNFRFPKLANMRKYVETIQEFGMISFSDTGPKESLNKGLRATYESTNRKYNRLTEQVADKVNLTEALREAKAACATHSQHNTTRRTTGAVSH